jgi:hypothetical protein
MSTRTAGKLVAIASEPAASEPARGTAMIASLISARPRELLGIYLNDHLAGAVAGSELARRCQRNNLNTRYATPLRQVSDAIAEDRATLER